MSKSRITVVLAAIAALGGVGLWAGNHQREQQRESSRVVAAAQAATQSEAQDRDNQIAFWELRAREDPVSAASRARLAHLFLQRGRETGSYDDVLRAEQAARASLKLRTAHNYATYLTLTSSLLAQHRFPEARDAARKLYESEPENAAYRAILGETLLELGDYEAARTVFGSVEPARNNLDVSPRLARWFEISGQPVRARELLENALDQIRGRTNLPREQVAWFHLRLGEFELRNGRLKQAEHALRAGLEVSPEDHRLMAAMARLAAARGRWEQAADYGERAIGVSFDPTTVGLMAQTQAELGDSASAQDYLKAMEVATSSQTEPFHRAYGLFLLDHGRRIPEVAAKAVEEIQTRRDVYGYDLLAWALHKQGRNAEAKRAMALALRMGTQDALLFYHAGMIERALGDNAVARKHLQKALDINPHFHPAHAAAARATLKALGRTS